MSTNSHMYATPNPLRRCARCGKGQARHGGRDPLACPEWTAVKTAIELPVVGQEWQRKAKPAWKVRIVAYFRDTALVHYETRGGVGIGGFRREMPDERFVRLFEPASDPCR